MTQENKELLLKDLCARLPYGVKCKYYDCCEGDYEEGTICGFEREEYMQIDGVCIRIEEVKPYLFPLSSMTDEMLEELNANGFFKYRDTIANVSHLESKSGINEEIYTYIDIECISFLIKYFHSNHIDYKGFIETGLAIDATGLNIY